jgi:hypothetical protein
MRTGRPKIASILTADERQRLDSSVRDFSRVDFGKHQRARASQPKLRQPTDLDGSHHVDERATRQNLPPAKTTRD